MHCSSLVTETVLLCSHRLQSGLMCGSFYPRFYSWYDEEGGGRMMILSWTIVLLLKQLWDFIVTALDESEDWDIRETLSNHSSCNWQRKKIVNEKKRLVMCTGWTPRRSGCVIILYSLDKAERNYVSEADQITNTTIDTNRVNQSTSSLYFPQILIQ